MFVGIKLVADSLSVWLLLNWWMFDLPRENGEVVIFGKGLSCWPKVTTADELHCVVCSSTIYGFWLPLLVSSNSACPFVLFVLAIVFCSPTIYGFWLPLWYLQTRLVIRSYYLHGNSRIWFKDEYGVHLRPITKANCVFCWSRIKRERPVRRGCTPHGWSKIMFHFSYCTGYPFGGGVDCRIEHSHNVGKLIILLHY